jgi:hypothetical protein
MQFSGKTYEILKWLCLIALPATSTLYWSLASIWGWPYVEQISGTIAAVGTFLGVMIGISTVNYYSEERHED